MVYVNLWCTIYSLNRHAGMKFRINNGNLLSNMAFNQGTITAHELQLQANLLSNIGL